MVTNTGNKVELLGYYGGDVINACSAWTSTSRDLTDEKRDRIPKLLKSLAQDGHHTPFEKSIVHFLMDSDVSAHIHALKHRISSINAESARYKELTDKFYLPEDWRGIVDSNNVEWIEKLRLHTELSNSLYHECLEDVSKVLSRKRAKESARFFKTYNTQIQSDVMFNWRSFVNFQTLRNSEHAQKEIREIAVAMLDLVKDIEGEPFKHTIAAFNL